MKVAHGFTDYQILALGGGEKLERIGDVVLLRPDPQVIWPAPFKLSTYKDLNAYYIRSSTGGGRWERIKPFKEEWTIGYKNLKFLVKPMGFKHIGVFPEQAVNWDILTDIITNSPKKEINVLNLFAYTGGATLACALSGAKVTHVDAAKAMVERAKQNANLSKVDQSAVRYIIDDCQKFVQREIKRGKRYDGIIMDPPSFGRGPLGEMWKLEDNLYDLVSLCAGVLSQEPLFFLINSYTTGLQPAVLNNILTITMPKGTTTSYEVCLPAPGGVVLPCGCSGLWTGVSTTKKATVME